MILFPRVPTSFVSGVGDQPQVEEMKPVTQLKTPYNQNLSENMLNRQLTQLTQLTPTPSQLMS